MLRGSISRLGIGVSFEGLIDAIGLDVRIFLERRVAVRRRSLARAGAIGVACKFRLAGFERVFVEFGVPVEVVPLCTGDIARSGNGLLSGSSVLMVFSYRMRTRRSRGEHRTRPSRRRRWPARSMRKTGYPYSQEETHGRIRWPIAG